MKRFHGNKRKAVLAVEETIADAMLGTGEHMCTCAALVADIILEQGQELVSLHELLGRIEADGKAGGSTAEKIP